MDIRKSVAILLFTTVISAGVQAENIGLYLGLELWNSKPSGIYGTKNNLIRAESKDDQQTSYYIELIHPYRFIPNVRINRSSFDASAQSEFSREYSNDTNTAHVDIVESINSNARFNISYVDYTLFYQVFNNEQLSLDLGLTARDFGDGVIYTEIADTTTTTRDFIWDGPDHDDHDYHNIVEETQTTNTENLKANEIEPMLFIAGNVLMPIEGLAVFTQANISLASDHSIYDYSIGIDYDLLDNRMVDLNISAGYRTSQMDFEDLHGLYSNIEFKGMFIGLTARF